MTIQKKVLDCFAALAMTMLLFLAVPASAQSFPEHGGSPVVDQADLLRPEQELDLKSKSEALYAQTGRSFVVATVNSLDGLTIEDYGYRLGRHWKLGGETEDDGVILLVAPNEKKVRIETGYGAEASLPDILGGRIIRDTILPRFKAGDMAGGIVAGADQIIEAMSLPAEEAQRQADAAVQQERERERNGQINFVPIVFWMMIIAFVILSLGRRAGGRKYRSRRGGGISPWVILWGLSELSRASRGRGGWGGGSWGGGSWGGGGGGGFGGFGGGGSFGGGGASGSW